LISLGSLVLALLIVWFLLPVFSDFSDRPLRFGMIMEFPTLIRILAIMVVAGLLAGSYPAFHLASFSALSLIKEDFKHTSGRRRSDYLRNILIVLQYVISTVALICTFTVLRQLNFIKNTDLGFVKDNILTVNLRDPAIRKNPEVLVSELRANSKIEDITASANLPVTINSNSRGNWEGKPSDFNLGIYKAGIGNNFIDFYNLKVISGRGFSNDFSTDTINKFIINETAAKLIGWDDPIGQKFGFNEDMGIVIGVIKDFYFHSLRLPVEPLAISSVGSMDFKETSYISVKVNPGTISETRLFVEERLKELSPHYLNPVSIFSDRVEAMYSSDRKLATIFIFSTILAVILTCLGQYSLSSYTTKSRTKEMVIRKVMGSHPAGIMEMLITEMAKWILVSIVFAWPIAYILMTKWLQDFAYHINIGTVVFLYSLLISFLISLIAVSYHAIKLSRVNPAEMIRHE
jgi:putative ABC transport system permease protein